MTVWAEFLDCFRTILAEFSILFLDSHDRIFETIFRQSRTVLRFGFAPETDLRVLWCVLVSQYSVMNREGTKMCPVLYGSEIWAIFCVITRK